MKKLKIKKIYLLEDKKITSGYTQLVIVDENNQKWIVGGDYCGGIPVSSWHKLTQS